MATVSDSNHLECGSFTLTEVTKHYMINHNLGAVPDFCILYPIDIAKTSEVYAIGFQVLVGSIGQDDWNISSKDVINGGWHTVYNGTSYSASVDSAYVHYNCPLRTGYAGTATDTTFEVGAVGINSNHGKLIPGTYGYILGRLNE